MHGKEGGSSLWVDLDFSALGYEIAEHLPAEAATHFVISRS